MGSKDLLKKYSGSFAKEISTRVIDDAARSVKAKLIDFISIFMAKLRRLTLASAFYHIWKERKFRIYQNITNDWTQFIKLLMMIFGGLMRKDQKNL